MSAPGPSLLLDENLSHRLLAMLVEAFPGSRHAREVALWARRISISGDSLRPRA